MKFMDCLNEDAKKKRTLSVHQGRAILITNSFNLLDSKQSFMDSMMI